MGREGFEAPNMEVEDEVVVSLVAPVVMVVKIVELVEVDNV
jgi:hypothetical protein